MFKRWKNYNLSKKKMEPTKKNKVYSKTNLIIQGSKCRESSKPAD